jgi:hypothetical protein
MVKWILRVLMLAFIAFLAWQLRSRFLPDEIRIKKCLEKLAETVSKNKDDGGADLLVKSQRLPDLLENPCRLNLPDYDVDIKLTPREAASELARMHSQLHVLTVEFMDVTVEVTEATATIDCTVRVTGTDYQASDPGTDTVEMVCELRKSDEDGVWRFAAFRQVDVLKR